MSTIKNRDNHRLYFAYGSNMDVEQMQVRCTGHELVGTARLDGHRVLLNSRGVATIVPEASAVVHGLVWSISDADEKSLDVYEGVARGLYRKERVRVVLADGDVAEALVYIASDSTAGRSRNGYLAGIVKAAERHGLPSGYIKELESWTTQREE